MPASSNEASGMASPTPVDWASRINSLAGDLQFGELGAVRRGLHCWGLFVLRRLECAVCCVLYALWFVLWVSSAIASTTPRSRRLRCA